MKALRCGDTAVLLEVDDLDAVLRLHAELDAADLPGVTDIVPAARTVLVRFDPAVTAADTVTSVARSGGATAPSDTQNAPRYGEPVEIGVRYDGPDLGQVGDLTGLGADGVVEAHTGQVWRVAFCGFAPGFGYLVGDDTRLHVPRLDTPRTRVPAGSVGLAGEFSGVYPQQSPGGWQLIGTTDAPLWDPDRDPPALLRPGTRVQFAERPC